jgi:peptide/nickel transport system permease protein
MSDIAGISPQSQTQKKRFSKLHILKRFPRSLTVGSILILIILLLILFAPLITPYDPIKPELKNVLEKPSLTHLFGTDNFGRDMLSRILYGGRVDIQIALFATFFSMVIGTLVGVIAGYFGGLTDMILMRILDVTISFPLNVLVIAIAAMLGPGLRSMYIAILIVSWVSYARLTRSECMMVKNKEFVIASTVAGSSSFRNIVIHIIPNIISSSIVYATSDAILNIVFVGTLGYLGLGIAPPTPEWGSMVAESRTFIGTFPYLTIIPSIAIIVTGLSFSLIGDGLVDFLRK